MGQKPPHKVLPLKPKPLLRKPCKLPKPPPKLKCELLPKLKLLLRLPLKPKLPRKPPLKLKPLRLLLGNTTTVVLRGDIRADKARISVWETLFSTDSRCF
jgi:hypothetical protein